MALLTARGFVAEDNATSYLGEIMLRDDQKLRVSGDSRDKPRRGVFHHSAGIRPIGWVGPRFYMNCSKTSLQPRFHSPPKSLAMNVPLSDPRHVPVLQLSGMTHTVSLLAQIFGSWRKSGRPLRHSSPFLRIRSQATSHPHRKNPSRCEAIPCVLPQDSRSIAGPVK